MRQESQAVFEKNFAQFRDIFSSDLCAILLLTNVQLA